MLVVLEELCPRARIIVCTDGTNGSFLLKRPNDTLSDIRSRNVHNIVSEDTVLCHLFNLWSSYLTLTTWNQIGKYVYKSQASRDLGDESKLLRLPLKVQKTLITRSGKDDVELIRCFLVCTDYNVFLNRFCCTQVQCNEFKKRGGRFHWSR